MTPNARDRAVAEAVVKAWHELPGSPDVLFTGTELRDAITAALATARAEERAAEREAVHDALISSWEYWLYQNRRDVADAVKDIAAALRARGEG